MAKLHISATAAVAYERLASFVEADFSAPRHKLPDSADTSSFLSALALASCLFLAGSHASASEQQAVEADGVSMLQQDKHSTAVTLPSLAANRFLRCSRTDDGSILLSAFDPASLPEQFRPLETAATDSMYIFIQESGWHPYLSVLFDNTPFDVDPFICQLGLDRQLNPWMDVDFAVVRDISLGALDPAQRQYLLDMGLTLYDYDPSATHWRDFSCFLMHDVCHAWYCDSTSIEPPAALPDGLELVKNYPNPFNPVTTLEIQLLKPSEFGFTVFNLNGQVLYDQEVRMLPAGQHSFQLPDTGAASGIQIARLKINDQFYSHKMVLTR